MSASWTEVVGGVIALHELSLAGDLWIAASDDGQLHKFPSRDAAVAALADMSSGSSRLAEAA